MHMPFPRKEINAPWNPLSCHLSVLSQVIVKQKFTIPLSGSSQIPQIFSSSKHGNISSIQSYRDAMHKAERGRLTANLHHEWEITFCFYKPETWGCWPKLTWTEMIPEWLFQEMFDFLLSIALIDFLIRRHKLIQPPNAMHLVPACQQLFQILFTIQCFQSS